MKKVQKGRKERLENHPFGQNHMILKEIQKIDIKLVFNHATGKELYRRTRIYGTNKDRLYYSFQNDTYTGRLNRGKKGFYHGKRFR